MWAELKFPPINLYSIYPTPQQCKDHAETLDPRLWDEDVNEDIEPTEV